MKRSITIFIAGVLGLALTAHAESDKKKDKAPPPPSALDQYLAQARQLNPAPPAGNGSLFSASSPGVYMFVDPKAHAANDVVTIQIVESDTGTNTADTSTQRQSGASAAAPGLFGLEKSTHLNFTNLLNTNTAVNFAGQGTTTRSGQLTASLSARVVEVLPNGNLVIQGTKLVTVNKEKQSLTIRGVIRQFDIAPNNIVQSTSIANMEVSFDGKGAVATSNHPGFLYWLFSKIIPL